MLVESIFVETFVKNTIILSIPCLLGLIQCSRLTRMLNSTTDICSYFGKYLSPFSSIFVAVYTNMCRRFQQRCRRFDSTCSRFGQGCGRFGQGCGRFGQGCGRFGQGCSRFGQGCGRFAFDAFLVIAVFDLSPF